MRSARKPRGPVRVEAVGSPDLLDLRRKLLNRHCESRHPPVQKVVTLGLNVGSKEIRYLNRHQGSLHAHRLAKLFVRTDESL